VVAKIAFISHAEVQLIVDLESTFSDETAAVVLRYRADYAPVFANFGLASQRNFFNSVPGVDDVLSVA